METFLQQIAASICIPQYILDPLAGASVVKAVIRTLHSTQRSAKARRHGPLDSSEHCRLGARNIDNICRPHPTPLPIADIHYWQFKGWRFSQSAGGVSHHECNVGKTT
jgi:hypothetical protein